MFESNDTPVILLYLTQDIIALHNISIQPKKCNWKVKIHIFQTSKDFNNRVLMESLIRKRTKTIKTILMIL